jgi:hypothetical protein
MEVLLRCAARQERCPISSKRVKTGDNGTACASSPATWNSASAAAPCPGKCGYWARTRRVGKIADVWPWSCSFTVAADHVARPATGTQRAAVPRNSKLLQFLFVFRRRRQAAGRESNWKQFSEPASSGRRSAYAAESESRAPCGCVLSFATMIGINSDVASFLLPKGEMTLEPCTI